MANPQSLIHGNAPARDALLMVAILGLAMLHVFELPRMVALHGGFAFFGAWVLGLLLLALPLLLLELMLGRRSRRSPLEGLAFLTREADARRGWRAGAWGSALANLLGLAVAALVAGGSINYLAQDMGVVEGGTVGISQAGLVLPLGTGSLFILAAGLSLLPALHRGFFILTAFAVALVLLGIAAFASIYLADTLYLAAPLTADTWREAFRLALLGFGGGLGVAWLGGMRLEREVGLGRLALGMVAVQVFLAALLLLALAPFVAASVIKAQTGVHLIASGSSAWMLLVAVILLGLITLLLLAEPLLLRLREKGLAAIPAVVLVFAGAAALAEAVWFLGSADGLHGLTRVLGVLLLLVLAVLSVFTGWGMKISHARKELALPSEAIYNVWRVAVRLVVPLAILWVLSGYIR
jgi:SNF family Na+-dependent transporter